MADSGSDLLDELIDSDPTGIANIVQFDRLNCNGEPGKCLSADCCEPGGACIGTLGIWGSIIPILGGAIVGLVVGIVPKNELEGIAAGTNT
tara:strand:- start:1738 stop:2010 length:273 start_codon:yes stop_codon:yes gene_type:complete